MEWVCLCLPFNSKNLAHVFLYIFQVNTSLVHHGHYPRYWIRTVRKIQIPAHNVRPPEATVMSNEQHLVPHSGSQYTRAIPATETRDYSPQRSSVPPVTANSNLLQPHITIMSQTNRICSGNFGASGMATRTRSPDSYTRDPPSYEGASRGLEENSSDATLPPPSYQEVMTGSFPNIHMGANVQLTIQIHKTLQDSAERESIV